MDKIIRQVDIARIKNKIKTMGSIRGSSGGALLQNPGGISIPGRPRDIGRHNALDKLAGDVLLREIPVGDKVATLSCRMSLEIIGKIIRTGIPVVISNAAPTLSAVRMARRAGLTVIGFARDNRFNIYSHDERICPGIV